MTKLDWFFFIFGACMTIMAIISILPDKLFDIDAWRERFGGGKNGPRPA